MQAPRAPAGGAGLMAVTPGRVAMQGDGPLCLSLGLRTGLELRLFSWKKPLCFLRQFHNELILSGVTTFVACTIPLRVETGNETLWSPADGGMGAIGGKRARQRFGVLQLLWSFPQACRLAKAPEDRRSPRRCREASPAGEFEPASCKDFDCMATAGVSLSWKKALCFQGQFHNELILSGLTTFVACTSPLRVETGNEISSAGLGWSPADGWSAFQRNHPAATQISRRFPASCVANTGAGAKSRMVSMNSCARSSRAGVLSLMVRISRRACTAS